MKNKTLWVMCGCAGAGKSTWIKNHLHAFNGYTSVISRDSIRFSLVKENEPYFSKENEVFDKFISDIKYHLNGSDNVIVDATHLNVSSRAKLFKNLGESLRGVQVNAIVIRTSLDTALAHNENRAGTRGYVPQSAIRRMYSQFVMPSFDEGFDKIYVYRPDVVGTKYTVFEKENK